MKTPDIIASQQDTDQGGGAFGDAYQKIDQEFDRLFSDFASIVNLSPTEKMRLRYGKDPIRWTETAALFSERQISIVRELALLRDRALGGHINALRELIFLSNESTRFATEIAIADSEYVSVVAPGYDSWAFLQTLTSAAKKEKDLLKRIKLGAAKPLTANSLPPLSKGEGGARIWARRLIRFIRFVRGISGVARNDSTSWSSWVSVDMEDMEPLKLRLLVVGQSWPKGTQPEFFDKIAWHPLHESILRLPNLEKSTAPQWWRIAEAILLLHTQNRPWDDKELGTYASSNRFQSRSRTQKLDGVKRGLVLAQVKRAFMRLARSM